MNYEDLTIADLAEAANDPMAPATTLHDVFIDARRRARELVRMQPGKPMLQAFLNLVRNPNLAEVDLKAILEYVWSAHESSLEPILAEAIENPMLSLSYLGNHPEGYYLPIFQHQRHLLEKLNGLNKTPLPKAYLPAVRTFLARWGIDEEHSEINSPHFTITNPITLRAQAEVCDFSDDNRVDMLMAAARLILIEDYLEQVQRFVPKAKIVRAYPTVMGYVKLFCQMAPQPVEPPPAAPEPAPRPRRSAPAKPAAKARRR